jgi:NitT/TauT family transport system substrate-binding protein
MLKPPFRLSAVLLISIFLLGACTGAGMQTPAKAPLRVGWSLWPGYYPIAIAKEKGFFDQHGVQVEPVFYSLYNNQPPELASGLLDGALLTLSDSLFDSISSSVKVVLVLDNSSGADQIVASSAVATLQDLRGKRLGVSSATVSGILLIRQMLEQNGIQPSEVEFVEVPPEKVPAAIPSLIDAGYTYDPFTAAALTRGDKVIFTSADAPGLIVDVLAFRTEITRNRPEDVKAFIAAWLEAVQYWKDNPAEGNAIIAKATGLTSAEISAQGATLFDLAANQKTFVQGSDASSVYFTAQKALQFLAINGDVAKPVNVNDLLDPSFLK